MIEVKNLSGKQEIEARMNAEKNTSVRVWIWQYMQTL